MITIMMIPDRERFLSVVRACKGDVTLHLPDDTDIDLKKDESAQKMLSLVDKTNAGLDIDLSDSTDVVSFLKYMASVNVA